jgi:nucleotidyltransferase/DNA polymerase involved in DNA repair
VKGKVAEDFGVYSLEVSWMEKVVIKTGPMYRDPNRHITHLDLDTFFVSVERLQNPKLIGKPVIVGGDGGRGVVASCSYEARKFGIHSAMPMYAGKRLCSHASLCKGDYEAYSKYSTLVTDVIRDTVPMFEKSSIDEFYIDMTGMDNILRLQFVFIRTEKKDQAKAACPSPMHSPATNCFQRSAPTKSNPTANSKFLSAMNDPTSRRLKVDRKTSRCR